MAHIKLPEFEEMTPAIQDKARPILEKTGKLGDIFKLLALDEKIYFATDGMIQKYLLDETTLSYDIKEAIALLISKENGCKMCVDVHKSIAKMLGLSEEKIEEILQGIDSMNVDTKDKALLNFCIKASGKENYKILKEEIDSLKQMGWSDVQIVEAVAITGYFNYINTLSNVFGLGHSN
ncbi:carboxymuconolactone decarboxylase family protein [Sulfurimonas paralvinellae]|uniref:Carboxymuconolactone decarboxylase family protein n=1 Tax=Sulfurimonas paralvinellae TaxID=317658 RepID=A0A7M1BAU2_9BACT|nr:carboxymuconolactone decarboxylase family protein [Sulfurimonas paralvinellae]QOP46536.1 carboxymuconolactone decarboxylase family protein [Sulfurimonas paralvinellae]